MSQTLHELLSTPGEARAPVRAEARRVEARPEPAPVPPARPQRAPQMQRQPSGAIAELLAGPGVGTGAQPRAITAPRSTPPAVPAAAARASAASFVAREVEPVVFQRGPRTYEHDDHYTIPSQFGFLFAGGCAAPRFEVRDRGVKRGHELLGLRYDARIYTLDFGVDTVEVYEPLQRDPRLRYPSVQSVAEALSVLGPELRRFVGAAQIHPMTDGMSLAMASSLGHLIFMPQAPGMRERPGFLQAAMFHEAAHLWHYGWSVREWEAWAKAAYGDGVKASEYAKVKPEEDVAETVATYFLSKIAGDYEAYREKLPHRFALLEKKLPLRQLAVRSVG